MPTYDYECESCGHRFEVFQSMSDEPIKRCPKCGKKVRRLIGAGLGVIFKGSGFYVTDNKRSGNGSLDRASSKAGSDNGKNGEASGPKPEKKSTNGDGTGGAEKPATQKGTTVKDSA